MRTTAELTGGGGDSGDPPPMPMIAGMQKLSLQDFPGHPAAILFTRGCNLRCGYCHNSDLIGAGPVLLARKVWQYLWSRRSVLSGVVVTGGEPTLHPELPDFLYALRDLGYHIKLDSNGLRPEVIEELLAAHLIDHLSIDWKAAPSTT